MFFVFISKCVLVLRLRYGQLDFLRQSQNMLTICLYLIILNLVELLSNLVVLFFSGYTKEIFHFSWSWWCKMLLMNKTGCLLRRSGGQFKLFCLFWSVVYNMQGRVMWVDHGLKCRILSKNHSKSVFLSTMPIGTI